MINGDNLGQVLVAFTATEPRETHAIGEMIAFADFPTAIIVKPGGEVMFWGAHLCRLATPEEISAAGQQMEEVQLRVSSAVADLHRRVGDVGIAMILRAGIACASLRAGTNGAWTKDQRQAVGEAVTVKLEDMTGEDGSSPDWFDARHVDEVLDVIEHALLAARATTSNDDENATEAIVACLGDDAASLRQVNHEDERAANMELAARKLERMQATMLKFIDLCAIGDVDESTETHGWGDLIKEAKELTGSVEVGGG